MYSCLQNLGAFPLDAFLLILHTNKEELSVDVGVKDSLSWTYHEVTQLKPYVKLARQIVESQL